MSNFGKNIHRLLWFVLLPLLVSCNVPTSPPAETGGTSQPYILNSPDSHRLRGHIQILPDPDTGYSIEDIAQPQLQDQFVPFPDKTFDIRSQQVYWGKIQLVNRLPEGAMHSEWVLNFSSTFTQITLFRLAENGTWTPDINGTFVPAKEKNFTPTKSGNWFKLVLPPGEVVTLYFWGESERTAMPPKFHADIQPLAVYYDELVDAKTGSSLFTGFLLMMLFYNLIKFFIVKDRSYIYYSGYLLMVVVYTAFSSEDLEDWMGGFVFQDHPAYYNLFKISLYLGLMCWLAFIRSFLDLEHLLPKWDQYFRYVIWLGAPLMLVFVFLAFRYNFSYVIDDRGTLFYIALVTISGMVFIYPLYRTKDPKGYFITAGIAVISVGFLLTLFSRVSQMPFTVSYLKVCTIIEILVFSLGLAYRQKKQVEEKQQADFALRESRLLQEKKQVEADRLQELNDFKTRFYTNITHEFRTPLTVIMGMSSPLPASPKGGGDVTAPPSLGETERKLIYRNSADLLRLINQLLALSKLESGSLSLHPVHGNINIYLQYLTESFYSAAQQKGIRLVFHSEEREIWMDYDEEKIQHIIFNLLSNALKFTDNTGRIILHSTQVTQGGQPFLKLKVKDTGRGIPDEAIHRVFERFYQINPAEDSEGGTGIGLSLVKELVEFMGGRIDVRSEPGVGTEFEIHLPITANAPASATQAPPLPPIQTLDAPVEEIEETINAELPELLIIEDNQDIITYVKSVLAGRYTVRFARNGNAGIEQAVEWVPDIIISDVMMPGKNGYEVCETLKQDERTSHIPIVLLTAKASQQDKVTGLRFGADAYLNKPFDKEELLITMENLLELRRKLQVKYGDWRLVIGDSDAKSPVTNYQSPITDPEDVFLQKLRSVVEANLSNTDFEMPHLERALAMSRSQIYRKVKALTGKSPSLFIRSIRLQHGRHLLLTTDMTVSEIAYEVGYSALNNFSDAFLEEFGERPGKVRG